MKDILDLFENQNITEVFGNLSNIKAINGIKYHSGMVEEGDIFVCIKGYQTDGHKYANDAVRNGAILLVCEHKINAVDVPQIIVKESRKALAYMSSLWNAEPSKKIKMVGVTATNGKTTTTYMLRSIVEMAGEQVGFVGTVVIDTGKRVIASDLTTPESADLQGYLAEMVDNGVKTCIMEASSSALELDRVYGVDYDFACFNNIDREHIDIHGTFENYFSVKSRLITNLKESAVCVLSKDEPLIFALKEKTKAKVISFSVSDNGADVFATNLDLSSGFARFDLNVREFGKSGVSTIAINLGVAGYHSLINALSAAGLASAMGYSPTQIKQGLEAFKGVERRFEMIYAKDYLVFDDHFANAANINVTLKTISLMKYEKFHLLYAIRGNRGVIVNTENVNALLGWTSKLGIDDFIITLSRDVTGPKDWVTPEEIELHERLLTEAGIRFRIVENLRDAIELQLKSVKSGDVLLMTGSQGMDYGASIILPMLANGDEEVLRPLKNRVAGV